MFKRKAEFLMAVDVEVDYTPMERPSESTESAQHFARAPGPWSGIIDRGMSEPVETSFLGRRALSRGKCAALCASPGPVARDLSVPEVAPVGEDHCRAGVLDGVDDVLVPLGAAGLDDCLHAGIERGPRAVGEREERV